MRTEEMQRNMEENKALLWSLVVGFLCSTVLSMDFLFLSNRIPTPNFPEQILMCSYLLNTPVPQGRNLLVGWELICISCYLPPIACASLTMDTQSLSLSFLF
jgi:hypothetical protein